ARRRGDGNRGETDLQRAGEGIARRCRGRLVLLEVSRLHRLFGDEEGDDVSRRLLWRRRLLGEGRRGSERHRDNQNHSSHLFNSTRDALTVLLSRRTPVTSTFFPSLTSLQGPLAKAVRLVVWTT